MSTYNVNDSVDEMLEKQLAQAKDPRTSPYALKALCKSPNWLVRQSAASNPGTPEGSIWELSYDPDLRVREAAFARLDALGLRVSGQKIPVLVQSRAAEQNAKAPLDEKIASASTKAGNGAQKENIPKNIER